jgi:pilus assembly protein Flp/PilA
MFAHAFLTVRKPREPNFDCLAQGGVSGVFGRLKLTDWRPEMAKFVKLLRNSEGATAIEYGLIAALIAVAAIGAMQGIGTKLNSTFNNVSGQL